MNTKVDTILVGAAGYGEIYLQNLLQNQCINLKAIIDIFPEKSKFYNELIKRNIPIYSNLEDFFTKNYCDLTIIATPIHLHTDQAIIAMENGSNVLCEKPLCADIHDVDKLLSVEKTTGKFMAVGFNWSFTKPILDLKTDLISGKFGKIKRAKSITLWPRTNEYFTRSSWAGRLTHPNGQLILDSVANNATAHFLHNLFYLCGEQIEDSATIKEVHSFLYRANNIESFDTCSAKIITNKESELFFFASHATQQESAPTFEIECEKATITYTNDLSNNAIIATMNDGSKITYADPELNHLAKLDICIQAIINEDFIPCGIKASYAHVRAIYLMHQKNPIIRLFDKNDIVYDSINKLTYVKNLDQQLTYCYDNWKLFE